MPSSSSELLQASKSARPISSLRVKRTNLPALYSRIFILILVSCTYSSTKPCCTSSCLYHFRSSFRQNTGDIPSSDNSILFSMKETTSDSAIHFMRSLSPSALVIRALLASVAFIQLHKAPRMIHSFRSHHISFAEFRQ